MKVITNKGKVFLAFILTLICININAQNKTYWYSELKVQGITLPITLEIENQLDTIMLKMGSPSQTKDMFPITKQRFTEDSILFNVKNMGVTYRGKFNSKRDSIFGNFKQGLMTENLFFVKQEKLVEINRPQEPVPPYPYLEEELSFTTQGVDYNFKGTLTIPSNKEKYPCVILITGSGLQNRDEEIMGHKPFKVIADYLTRNGIAVFRYDDRGWGSADKELLNNSTTLDFAKDAMSAFEMLKNHPNIDSKNIGMMGHSEGGAIAPICASENKSIKFIILLAGPGERGIDVLLQQNEAIFKKSGIPDYALNIQLSSLNKIYSLIEKNISNEEIEIQMNKYFDHELSKLNDEEKKNVQFNQKVSRNMFISQVCSNWMRCFLQLNPQDYLSKVKQPTFVLNGDKDLQVLYQHNIPSIEKSLKKAKNKNFEIYVGKNMNHLFQECETGEVDEYQKIEQTISPVVLEKLKEFILKYTK